jgi:hypothetical protein
MTFRPMYQNLFSPSRRTKLHRKCLHVDCPPFGTCHSCTSPLLQQIHETVNSCKTFVPSISLQQLMSPATVDQLDALVTLDFPTPTAVFNGRFFSDSVFQMNQLREAARILLTAASLQVKLDRCLKRHDTLPSENAAFVVLWNLKTLNECISRKRATVESTLWKGLDDYPEQAEIKLRALMNQVRRTCLCLCPFF